MKVELHLREVLNKEIFSGDANHQAQVCLGNKR